MRAAPTLQAGDSARSRQIGPVTATDIVRFAGAGGDFNPLHHDEAFARSAGFASIIAMGQLSAGILAGFLTDWVGIENLRFFEVRFVSPVFVGDLIDLAAEVTELRDAEAIVGLTARSGDTVVVTATARVIRSSQR